MIITNETIATVLFDLLKQIDKTFDALLISSSRVNAERDHLAARCKSLERALREIQPIVMAGEVVISRCAYCVRGDG